MDFDMDGAPESARSFKPVSETAAEREAARRADPAVEINARRAALENPELLRRLRSL